MISLNIEKTLGQTGPAQRYDENVINRHLEMLKSDYISWIS